MTSSFDQVGPIAKTVEDAEIVFNCIKGRDLLDSTSLDLETVNYKLKTKNLKIGVPRVFTASEGIDKTVTDNFNQSLKALEKLGYNIKDILLPTISHSLAVYYIIMPAEASTNLARFDGVKYGLRKEGGSLLDDYRLSRGEGFGREVRRRILLGSYVLSSGYYDAYYNKAVQVQQDIKNNFDAAFKQVDILVTPTTPTPAFKIGEKSNNPLSMYLADIFTVSANIAGIPAISVPSGVAEVSGRQLPLGLQFMASVGGESLLFEVGKAFCFK